ncbi:ABC transporter permease [Cohnella candidum]|uniref:ABC transporter permease n=1 Tax=Cohnella candidum TaxID=2674991 RepID=A0A3G3JZS4_9BACL|nr:ABC transporter permease [Cohnella candidum]AYQ73756.1 ABC transporter permease [Cohnella candidum]
MQDFLWLMKKTFQTLIRRKSALIVMALPIAGVLLSMLIYGNSGGSDLRVGIVNLDGGEAVTEDAAKFVAALNKVKVTQTDEASLRKDLAAGKLDAGIVFGKGFADGAREGSPAAVEIVSVKGAQVTAYMKAMLQSYVSNVASIGQGTKGDPEAFDRIYAEYAKHAYTMKAETLEDTSHRKDITYQSLGYLIAFMMFSAVSMSEMILKEKENRTFLRLLSSPVSAKTYVLANVAVNFLVLTVQIILTLIFMKTVLRVDSGIPFGEMLLPLLLFALTAIGLSLLIVAFAKSSAAAGALQNLIITPTCLVAGCYIPATLMPESLLKVSHFLPQHWLLNAVDRLQHGQTFGSLYMNFFILLAFTAAFTVIAIYRFGRNNDTRLFV